MTFGGLSAGGEWRKKRPGKWLKWREEGSSGCLVVSLHFTPFTPVRGFECRRVVSFVGVVVFVVIAIVGFVRKSSNSGYTR